MVRNDCLWRQPNSLRQMKGSNVFDFKSKGRCVKISTAAELSHENISHTFTHRQEVFFLSWNVGKGNIYYSKLNFYITVPRTYNSVLEKKPQDFQLALWLTRSHRKPNLTTIGGDKACFYKGRTDTSRQVHQEGNYQISGITGNLQEHAHKLHEQTFVSDFVRTISVCNNSY